MDSILKICSRLFLSALLAIFTVIFTAESNAATFTVTNFNDAGPGSLRRAISDANDNPNPPGEVDMIAFTTGTGVIPDDGGPGQTTFTGEMLITDSVAIIGPDPDEINVNAQSVDRIFNIFNPAEDIVVSITRLTLEQALSSGLGNDSGGAIWNREELSIDSCEFSENAADEEGAAIFNDVSGTITSITNTNFLDSTADGNDGGAILNLGIINVIDDCVFEGNFADDDGGAIHNENRIDEITETTFENNSSDDNGGAISNETGALIGEISNTDFIENDADGGDGGAIDNDGMITTLTQCLFDDNFADNDGGAIHNDADGDIVEISYSTFENNNSDDDGGAIENNDFIGTIKTSIFRENNASEDGGAISNETLGIIQTISTTTFQENGGCFGGGILNAGDINLISTSIFFTHNACAGGAIFNEFDADIGELVNTTFYDNFADVGGAILNAAPFTIDISFSTIAGNFAEFGGGIFNDGTLNIKNSLVVDNESFSGVEQNCENDLGTVNDNGGNITDSDGCFGFANTSFDPSTMLDTPDLNGGPTETMALIVTMAPSNPAIDAITQANCTDNDSNPVTTDQRPFLRPVPNPGNCDVGAFEIQPTADLEIEKVTIPGGGMGFEFLGTNFPQGCIFMDTFFLDDGGIRSCTLPLGMYTVQEIGAPDHRISNINCEGDSPFNTTADSLTITLGDGDFNLCTFENTLEYTLTLDKESDGNGTVTSSPAGINCGSMCMTQNADFDFDTGVITLTATPDFGSQFDGWGEDCAASGMDMDAPVTLDMDRTCSASFSLLPFTLDVTKSGIGDGTVTSAPPGIDCGIDCTEDYLFGTMVTLTATPDADSDFVAFTGDPDCEDGTVTVDAAMTCDAEFALKQFDVTVIIAGSGIGTVTSAPGGIDCPGDCSETYDIHTAITLTPTPDAVSVFTGWSPNCAGGVIPDLTADTVCTATIEFLPLILNPISPAIASNFNEITAENASPSGLVAFIWGFMAGNVTVGGPTCNGLVVDIKQPRILAIVDAFPNGFTEYLFWIPLIGDFDLAILTQAIDIDTCRKSEVVQNIIRKE